jgi:hypothetical protein
MSSTFVFANASKYSILKNRHFPHLNQDSIALLVSNAQANFMRKLKPGKEAEEYTKITIFPNIQYSIVDNEGIIRYTTIPNPKTVKISPQLKASLKKLLLLDHETSGQLSQQGITHLKKGTKDHAPFQTKRKNHITFHVHPVCLYEEANTNAGWPSLSDIVAVKDKHIVVTFEGLYLMGPHKTCSPPPKKNTTITEDRLQKLLTKCSWLLFPWDYETIYIPV